METVKAENNAKIEGPVEKLEAKMEDKIEGLNNDFHDLAMSDIELKGRVEALEKAVAILSNTLHVIDATSLLSLYSLIKTDNLRQPNFTNNQDIIDSGCSDAINRMMKTVTTVNANELKNKKSKDNHGEEDKSEGR